MTSLDARLIVDEPQLGPINMAIDQALLESAEDSGIATLRFYQWAEPTLSLGYFQKFAERNQHLPSSECAIVRRSSGGGAIVHEHELTYSLCLPGKSRWSQRNQELYKLVHSVISRTLAELWQIPTSLFVPLGDTHSSASQDEPFLCFLRRTVGDLILHENKIGGSAQRRNKNALIQHGSILLAQSPHAPELEGILELSRVTLDAVELANALAVRLSKLLKLPFESGGLSDAEISLANSLVDSRFCNAKWTQKR